MAIRTDRFPWDPSSDAVLELAAELNPDDHSRAAEYVREVAGSVHDHREWGPCACDFPEGDAPCVSRFCVQKSSWPA